MCEGRSSLAVLSRIILSLKHDSSFPHPDSPCMNLPLSPPRPGSLLLIPDSSSMHLKLLLLNSGPVTLHLTLLCRKSDSPKRKLVSPIPHFNPACPGSGFTCPHPVLTLPVTGSAKTEQQNNRAPLLPANPGNPVNR